MNDTLVDEFIFRKKGSDYYVNSMILAGEAINAGLFGVKADGVTDDSDSLQRAFDFCGKNGWKLRLPIGEMAISKRIECDMRGAYTSRQFQLIGAGINMTVINCTGNMNGGLYFFSDDNNPFYLTISGFSIKRPDVPLASGGVGIYVEKLMGITIKDIEVFKFNTGMQIMDTCTSLFENVKTHWGDIGFYGEMQTITNPNVLTFTNCGFNSNSVKGVQLVNIHNVKFDGCAFAGNSGNALEASFNASNGRTGLNLINNYFEGTSNGVDVYYTLQGGGTANYW